MRSELFARLLLTAGLLATLAPGCAAPLRRFPMAEPMWVDTDDLRSFGPRPEEYYSGLGWDAADNMVFRPAARFFAVDPGGEAANVNAMDEVPNSSWFTNRLSVRDMSVREMIDGRCGEAAPLNPEGPWTVIAVKPDGATPGFIIRDPEGRRHLMKFDRARQPERATAADVIGSILYYAAGYFTPCNRMVFFDQDVFELDPEATTTVLGEEVPLTWELFQESFDEMIRLEDGRYRGMTSLFLPGRPIGPWRYEGYRSDDPNDVVPHEDRRELRGAYVWASWINHFDSREQNTLAMWLADGEDSDTGHVRHNYVDFGDSLGSLWARDAVSRRVSTGSSGYFNLPHIFQDFITLGLLPRTYHRQEFGPAGAALGYFDDTYFDPEGWHPGYQNPAFLRRTERDAAWAARAIAFVDNDDLEAIVNEAHLENRTTHNEVVRILKSRRRRLLQRWMRHVSPLAWPTLRPHAEGTDLCLKDLAVRGGIVDQWSARPYWARAWQHDGDGIEVIEVGRKVRRNPDWVCVDLPELAGASEEQPGYLIVDVAAQWYEHDTSAYPARVHLYQTAPGHYRIVGLQRPTDLRAPRP